jgi:hypothetical protein
VTLYEWIWLATAAWALHGLEEYVFGWAGWAESILRLRAGWSYLVVANAVALVLGVAAAEIAPQLPGFALCFPALLLVHVLFLHVVPVLRSGGKFSPGLITAIALLFPISFACYRSVQQAGILTGEMLLASFAGGASLAALPGLFLHLRDRPYFVGSSRGNHRA